MVGGSKPSRESMREVKKEYEERRKADAARAEETTAYWAAQTGRRPPRRRRGPVVGAVALLAVGSLTAAAVMHVGPFAAVAAGPSRLASPQPSGPGPAPSPTPSSTDGTDPAVVAAFQGSPAASWAVGRSGIVTPPAHQVGIYRTKQVAEAYAHVTAYLRAALLDPRVVYRAKLDPVFAVLGASSTRWLKEQQALNVSTKNKAGVGWDAVANRFHVGDWKASPEIRVKGTITSSQSARGELVVHFVYIAAYWLVPGKGGVARTVAIRRTGSFYFNGNGSQHVTAPSYGGSGYTSTASVCGSHWPYRDFVEAWTDPADVTVATPSPITTSFDAGNLDQPDPTSCFEDTSGFGH